MKTLRRRLRHHRRSSERAVAASRRRNAAGQAANGEPRALREELAAFFSTSAPHALVAVAVVGGAIALVFAGCLDNGFVTWDDDVYIYANPHIQSFTMDNLYWMLTNASRMYWHPLAYLSHAVDFAIGGANPGVHHLTSVLLHGVNALLVLGLFIVLLFDSRRRRPEKDPGLQSGIWVVGIALAVLFGVHPLRVESVAWAAEKKDLLCALFVLVAVMMHFFFADARSGRERKLLYGGLCAATGLALLSKAMAVTLPALLLVLDVYPLRRHERLPLRALVVEKLPLAAMSLAVLLINVMSAKDADDVVTAGVIGGSDRLLLACWGFVFPLAKTLWPTHLVPVYPLPPPAEIALSNPRYLLSALALVAMTLFCGFQWRRGSRGWLAAWACYLVLMTPVSGLRTLGSVATADRWAYLPLLSFTLLAGAGLVRLWQRASGRHSPRLATMGLLLPLAAIATVLGFRTAEQVEVWKDSETFWTYVAESFPGRVAMAHNNLGAIHHQRALETRDPALFERASAEYRRAIAVFPGHANAHNNLGMIAYGKGDFGESERRLLQATRIAPRHPLAHANLARLYVRLGDMERAAHHARIALENGGEVHADVRQALDRLPGRIAP